MIKRLITAVADNYTVYADTNFHRYEFLRLSWLQFHGAIEDLTPERMAEHSGSFDRMYLKYYKIPRRWLRNRFDIKNCSKTIRA